MENIHIPALSDSPEVILDFNKNKFQFKGRSLPEDVDEFYKPIEEKLKQYLKTVSDHVELVFNFEYFNTASSKKILDILTLFGDKFLTNKDALTIKWNYRNDDEDMLDAGKDLQEITELDFHFELM
ncbi:MAG: DUF1987 domain-containing protein [Bacteroidales bacterium]|nr:DUF1987 domain-containing protein [Bacteroidales bacterium]